MGMGAREIAGLRLLIKMEYYNYRMVPGEVYDDDEANKIDNSGADTVCVMTLRPFLLWTSQGNKFNFDGSTTDDLKDNYDYGVLVTFESGGLIGAFDNFRLFTALTQILVMLSVAAKVTAFIARNYVGKKSVLYTSVTSERLDALSIYSRFAVQTITASLAYDIVDNDGSGRINKSEIYAQLRKLFSTSMNERQIATLVEFMVYMAHETHIPQLHQAEIETEAYEADGTASLADNIDKEADQETGSMSMPANAARTMRTRSNSLKLSFPSRRRGTHKSHVSRAQWVTVFAGHPCTLEQCIDVINHKSDQGEFTPKPQDMKAYEELDKALLEVPRLSVGEV
ncbi:hypothetical protein CYMTET_35141, partial [Cymbomonas tetramitiformis]